MLRTVALSARRTLRAPSLLRPFCSASPPHSVTSDPPNRLEDLRTREHIHSSLAARALDVIRYDYFAQRADLEAELEAAATFRSLTETARQQAMGYLELLEEYGDADFGATVQNLDVAADHEREGAEQSYLSMAGVAAEEQLEDVDEWFQDMAAASVRAADRLELVSSMIEAEEIGAEEGEEDEGEGKEKQ